MSKVPTCVEVEQSDGSNRLNIVVNCIVIALIFGLFEVEGKACRGPEATLIKRFFSTMYGCTSLDRYTKICCIGTVLYECTILYSLDKYTNNCQS